jgi:hypothetical protein
MDYFVTPNYVITTTNIGRSVDQTIITPVIATSADMWVRSIMGTLFYQYLLIKYNAQTLNAAETVLVADYIKPAVAWRTASEVVIDSSIQIRNKGAQKQTGDYSNDADFAQLGFIAKNTQQKAMFYENRLSVWLYDNKGLFPEFEDPDNKDSSSKNTGCSGNGSNFQSGVNFM